MSPNLSPELVQDVDERERKEHRCYLQNERRVAKESEERCRTEGFKRPHVVLSVVERGEIRTCNDVLRHQTNDRFISVDDIVGCSHEVESKECGSDNNECEEKSVEAALSDTCLALILARAQLYNGCSALRRALHRHAPFASTEEGGPVLTCA